MCPLGTAQRAIRLSGPSDWVGLSWKHRCTSPLRWLQRVSRGAHRAPDRNIAVNHESCIGEPSPSIANHHVANALSPPSGEHKGSPPAPPPGSRRSRVPPSVAQRRVDGSKAAVTHEPG
jgi:hypothetical protein